MPDPENTSADLKQITGDDLRIIIDGSSKTLILKDRNGEKHILQPLTLRDIIDFENEIQTSILGIMNANLTIRHITYLLYCSMRKEGCSLDDLKRRKYKYSEADVHDMFDMGFLRSATSLFTNLLKISGFGKKEQEAPANPQISPASVSEPSKGITTA